MWWGEGDLIAEVSLLGFKRRSFRGLDDLNVRILGLSVMFSDSTNWSMSLLMSATDRVQWEGVILKTLTSYSKVFSCRIE